MWDSYATAIHTTSRCVEQKQDLRMEERSKVPHPGTYAIFDPLAPDAKHAARSLEITLLRSELEISSVLYSQDTPFMTVSANINSWSTL